MPVLVEEETLISRVSVLDARLDGGAAAFRALVPPGRCSEDGEIVAVSFGDHPSTGMSRLGELARRGLDIECEGMFADVAFAHHLFGPTLWCPWLEFAVVPLPAGGRVLAARAAGSARTEVAVPPGWRHEGSRTHVEGVVRLAATERPLRFVRREPEGSVYVDRFAGTEVRVGLSEPPGRVAVETAAGARHDLIADVVRGGPAVGLGLMHRERLDADAGMLFLFPEEERRSFWMKNTLIPLDMLFVNREGTVVNVVERATPMTLAPRRSARPASAVLEVNGGWSAAHGVRAGDRVELLG